MLGPQRNQHCLPRGHAVSQTFTRGRVGFPFGRKAADLGPHPSTSPPLRRQVQSDPPWGSHALERAHTGVSGKDWLGSSCLPRDMMIKSPNFLQASQWVLETQSTVNGKRKGNSRSKFWLLTHMSSATVGEGAPAFVLPCNLLSTFGDLFRFSRLLTSWMWKASCYHHLHLTDKAKTDSGTSLLHLPAKITTGWWQQLIGERAIGFSSRLLVSHSVQKL